MSGDLLDSAKGRKPMRRIVKNAAFSLVATLIASVAVFAASIISARVLGPSALGVLSFVMWLFTTLVLLAKLGMSGATVKFVSEIEGAGQRPVANSLALLLVALQGGLGLLLGLVLATFSSWIATILGQAAAQRYLVILGIGMPMAMLAEALRACLAGFQRYDLISIVSTLLSSVTLVGTVVLLHYGFDVDELIFLAVGVYFLQLAIFGVLIWRRHNLWPWDAISFALVRRVLRYCISVFVISCLDIIVWQRSEMFFIGRFSTVEQLAYYGLAYSIVGAILATPALTLAGVLVPALSQYFGAGQIDPMHAIYANATRLIGFFVMPICLGGIAVSQSLVSYIYGIGYLPMVGPLRVLFIAGAVGALSVPGTASLLALGKSHVMAVWGIPTALLNITLALALVPRYGGMGAAMANTASQALGAAISVYLICKQGFRFPFALLLRIAVAAGVSVSIGYLITQQVLGWSGIFVGVSLSVALYIPGLMLTKALGPSDFSMIRGWMDILPVRLGADCKNLLSAIENKIYGNGKGL